MSDVDKTGGERTMSAEERKQAFYGGIFAVDFRESLPVDLIEALEPGDDFYKVFPGPREPLAIGVKRETVGNMLDPGQAYHGAVDAGLIERGASYDDFKNRDVVTIYSEFHGGHAFTYDAATGQRFLPRGDVSNLDAGLGARQVALGDVLESMLAEQQ